MRTETKFGYCRECVANGELKLNHLRFFNHLFMCFVTMFAWLPIWMVWSILNRQLGWCCSKCGSKSIEHQRRKAVA